QARFVPLSDGAADAFERLHDRGEFTTATDYVFCNRLGRALEGAVLRRRFKRTAAAAGLRVLRFHALRHGAGSLVARQADARWVQGFLGHSKITTTERYLHTKARPEDVDRLNRAFAIPLREGQTMESDPGAKLLAGLASPDRDGPNFK
ncbi:MAG: tyrosine-type recombinase/integrase, partial [Solirubrobacterales bacterium]|nr:tyrosine-type recombinase/integrase [Solirubrobacterales bacterium]